MKKYIIYSLLVILIFVILFICYDYFFNNNNENNTNQESLKKDIVDLEQQLQDIKGKTVDNSSETKNINVNATKQGNEIFGPPIIYDPIANFDMAKLNDPLVDPRGRAPANQIPTPLIAAQFNFPTQGVIDRYHRVGLLIAIDDDNYSDNSTNSTYSTNSTNSSGSGTFSPNSAFDDSLTYSALGISNPKANQYTKYNNNNKNYKKNKKNKTKRIKSSLETFASYQDDNAILELIGKKIANEWYRYFTSVSMGNKIIKVNVENKNRRELYSGDIVYIKELNRKYRVEIDKMDNIEYNPYFF